MDPLKRRARIAIGAMCALGLTALVWRSQANRRDASLAPESAEQVEAPRGEEVGPAAPSTPQPTSPKPERALIPKPAPAGEDTLSPTDPVVVEGGAAQAPDPDAEQVTLPFEVDMGDGGVPADDGEGLVDRQEE